MIQLSAHDVELGKYVWLPRVDLGRMRYGVVPFLSSETISRRP